MTDKQRVTGEARFDIIPGDNTLPFKSITAVCVIPILPTGEIVSVVLQRGVDIPGGHVQHGETSLEQVAVREAAEEAAVTVRNLSTVAFLKSSVFVAGSEGSPSYIAILTGVVSELLPFRPTEEVRERRITRIPEFHASYSGEDSAIMRTLVQRALSVIPSGQE